MIVNYTESGWEITTQRAHGLLAAQICAYWRKDLQPARWIETLIATAEHDDIYNEFENNDLLNQNKGPVNYKATVFKAAYARRLIDMAETKSAYIALLVSCHLHFLYGDEPKAKRFLKKLKDRQNYWQKVAQINDAELQRGYALLQFCDAFSLLICQHTIQPEGRKTEISKGPDGTSYQVYAIGEDLIVEPWPFECDVFNLTFETRTLTKLEFQNIASFRKAISNTLPVLHQLKLKTSFKVNS